VVSNKTHRAVCAKIIRLLREERERRAISKYVMANRSGLSEQMIGYVERGLRNPSLETVVRMAAGLDIDFADIVRQAYDKER